MGVNKQMDKSKPVLVTRSSLPAFEEYCDEIREVWQTYQLTNMGVKHRQLANNLKEYLHTDNITLYTNGHLALENMLSVFRLQGEVITTPFTFVSTTNAIIRSGLTPVFCDVRSDNFTIDPQEIRKKITAKTKAILAVHVYGNLCDWKAIDEIAKEYNLKVFYDAAHAFGVQENGISVANLGDCSMFSFHATKVFHTVEGGALCYRDSHLSALFDSFKNFGVNEEGEYVEIGGNAKMSEFHAAMGLCNLRHLDREIERRKIVFERYVERLKNIEGIRLCVPEKHVRHNYAYFPAVFSGRYNRDKIFEKLKEKNIFARKYFYPLTCDTIAFQRINHKEVETPVARDISNQILCLPLYADLTVDMVDRIADIILEK